MFFLFVFCDIAEERHFICVNSCYFESVAELNSCCVLFILLVAESAVLKSDEIWPEFRAEQGVDPWFNWV